MRFSRLTSIAICGASWCAFAADSTSISGYVTRVSGPDAIDVAGVHVRLTPTTEFRSRTAGSTGPAKAPEAYFVGEPLDVKGAVDHSTHTMTATEVTLNPITSASVHGVAVIDRVPPSDPHRPAGQVIVRADGYLLSIDAKTKLNLTSPLKSISDIATNQWIEYSGVQQPDGMVVCDYAAVATNQVKHREERLLKANQYDPAAVTEDQRQSGASKFFLGVDPKRIPPYGDPVMQARVERIGTSLIPAYQRALPDSDPTKIHFKFQVIESTRWRDGVVMPTGIIVVPREVIERLQNDDQLAAVLADNIAEAIEKDALRMIPTRNGVGMAAIAGDVAGIFVPGLSLATGLGGWAVNSHAVSAQLEQSGRVSLGLMHDAGYDLTQAPIAWWLLASKKPEPMDKIKMPARAANLYMALGTTWHPVNSSVESTPGMSTGH